MNKEISKEFINKFNKLHSMRNAKTHDDIFTLEEYLKARRILIDEKLLEEIIDIEPISKTLVEPKGISLHDQSELNTVEVEGNLLELVNYQLINNITFSDDVFGISLLNKFANIFFNFAVNINERLIFERYIISDVDINADGVLGIKQINEEMGIVGILFNYLGLQARADGIEVLYNATLKHE